MNSLSLLIYLASVVNGLSVVFALIAVAISLLTFARLLYWSTECDVKPWHSEEEAEYKRNFKVIPSSWYVALPIVLIILAALIPDKESLYLIAASEAGETVVTSKEGQEILTELTKTIKDQLKGFQTDE